MIKKSWNRSVASARKKGFTLVEVAMASLVAALLMIALGLMVRMAGRMGGATNEKLDALQSATMISEIIHRDLRYMAFPFFAAPTASDEGLVTAGNENNAAEAAEETSPDTQDSAGD